MAASPEPTKGCRVSWELARLSLGSCLQEAGELYNRMLKRFRQEKAVWVKYGAFLLRRSQAGACRRVLQRALECLPTKEREC